MAANVVTYGHDLRTLARTPVEDCPACAAATRHTNADWKHHPLAGHGITREWGASHPDIAGQK